MEQWTAEELAEAKEKAKELNNNMLPDDICAQSVGQLSHGLPLMKLGMATSLGKGSWVILLERCGSNVGIRCSYWQHGKTQRVR
ncbi:hypothetical protein JVU11DRAFT_3182 [Chiua virens]|nr:hypothetical protein JVU11DRAFT_3182 [Chiua virens]